MSIPILNLDDRLNNIVKQAKKWFNNIPADSFQQRWNEFTDSITGKLSEEYFDRIESLTVKLRDQEDIINNLTLRNEELQSKIESFAIVSEKLRKANDDVNFAAHKIIKLEKDLHTEVQNRDHFRQLVKDADSLIRDLKSLRGSKQTEIDSLSIKLKEKSDEADHLARKAIQLTEENANLRLGIIELTSKNESLQQVEAENSKYRDQTVRLIEEKRKLQEQLNAHECSGYRTGEQGSLCGGCTSCMLQQSTYNYEVLSASMKFLRDELNDYKTMFHHQNSSIGLLYTYTIRAATSWFPPAGIKQSLAAYKVHQSQVRQLFDKWTHADSKPQTIDKKV